MRDRAALVARRAQTTRTREARAQTLGFENLASYLRARHYAHRWPYTLIAQELGVTVSVVRNLMQRTGVPGVRGVTIAKARRLPPTAHRARAIAAELGRDQDRGK